MSTGRSPDILDSIRTRWNCVIWLFRELHIDYGISVSEIKPTQQTLICSIWHERISDSLHPLSFHRYPMMLMLVRSKGKLDVHTGPSCVPCDVIFELCYVPFFFAFFSRKT